MDVNSIPLESIDVSDQDLYETNSYHAVFKRLRKEDPVHYFDSEQFGPFWSVTRYADIAYVEKNHQIYSSDRAWGGITIKDDGITDVMDIGTSFITMDQPQHTDHRDVVAGAFSQSNIQTLAVEIRRRAVSILEKLPQNEEFDWVEQVASELHMQMLGVLMGIPMKDRQKLLRWSNLLIGCDDQDVVKSYDDAREELLELVSYFGALRVERAAFAPGADLVSLITHGDATRGMKHKDFTETMVLLLIGGNDTTRNSISGGLHALTENPGQYEKLRQNPALIPTAVSEMIRWVTPAIHMRRTAVCDTELGGKQIKKGDKVVLWYVSGNRDEEAFENPDQFLVDRKGPRHFSFGPGIHHCLGARLAEMQLKILCEELLKRHPVIECRGEPKRLWSNLINGITTLPVYISA